MWRTPGPGRPVVLIHGWPLSGESRQYQVPTLTAAGYRVVTSAVFAAAVTPYMAQAPGNPDGPLSAMQAARESDQLAAVEAMTSFGTTDFRDDLPKVSVPSLVLHGTGDGVVPFR